MRIADILNDGYDEYCRRFGAQPLNEKVVRAITSCRTESLGGHRYGCPSCNNEVLMHNSCGNRHCPRCQAIARAEWMEARKQELLPVPYFHVVFTIPAELNPFALRNKKVFYSLMFCCVKETLIQAAGRKLPGARTGFITVLHTWGQNLMDHPHIHCIVPSGGLSRDGAKWIKGSETYLFPVAAMKILFRAKLLDYFKQALADKTITLTGNTARYNKPQEMKPLVNQLYKKEWCIYCKKPFAGPEKVVEYLGNYTHKIAISESRIVDNEDNSVTFRYKDYADNNKKKSMTLVRTEFIRRFLLHVLPTGFMRIRHYGFLSNACRKVSLEHCMKIFAEFAERRKVLSKTKKLQWHERVFLRTGKNPLLCSKCGKAVMTLTETIMPVRKVLMTT